MLTQVHRILTAFFFVLAPFLGILGCDSDDDLVLEPDTEPPAVPRGIRSITGDGQVAIEWFPNGEGDLAGYQIWRDDDNDKVFDLLEEVSAGDSRYVDRDVRNGITYYYAVSAFDLDNNESDLSPEVSDTPRPAGNNVTLNNFSLSPERSGFDFSRPERGAIAWDLPTTDVYFGLGTATSDNFVVENVSYLYSDNSTEMQDMGYHDRFDEIDVSPDLGFTTDFVELIEGHVYTLNTPERNFAKIHIVSISDNSVTFDWAYQLDPDNPELAPPLNDIRD
ncbi:MAG: hypothetical protein O7E52_06840 [Candidatus Poribacteria bacterium]|nr:hypothetical protein [Candidatus Poribacteria bacterium]